MTKKIIIVVLAVILCLGLVACKNDKDSQYTLTFYGFDGKTEVTKMEISGDRIVVPEAPEVEGYTFVGWYLDSPDSTLKVDAEFFMRNSANKDRSAYARYKENTYNVTFYSGEYKIAIMNTTDITGKDQALPVPPPNPYYVFEGWYLESGVEFTPEYLKANAIEEDLDVYAKYTREKFALTFMVDGKVYETMQVSDQTITLPKNPTSSNSKLAFAYWLPVGSTMPIDKDYFVSNPATKSMTVEAVFIDINSDFKVIPSGLGTCTITGYTGTDKIIVIPEEVYMSVGENYTPYKVEAIQKDAFKGNTNIEYVTINGNVKSIGANAFEGCKNLKTVIINGVVAEKNVGTNIFKGCTAITEIKAPTWIVSQLEKKTGLEKITFTAGEKIDAKMFENATKLESVVFPETLKEIGERAFAGCTALKAINIPASVNNIALDAFVNCSAVKTITVAAENEVYTSGNNANCIVKVDTVEIMGEPDENGQQEVVDTETVMTLIVGCANTKIFEGVNEVAEHAFVGCTVLKNLSIPASVNKIAETAFIGSTNILSITVEDGNEHYIAVGNCLIALSKDAEGKANNRLILGCKKSTIDRDNDDITSISKYAFANTAIESICIPAGVTELEEGSFYGCENLKNLVIISPELKFTDKVFDNYRIFTHIEIPETWLNYFRAAEDTYEIKCPHCSEMIRYTKGEGFDINNFLCPECDTKINAQTIQSKEKQVEIKGKNLIIQSIVLTTGTKIAEGYFAGWSNLTTVTLPDTIETIGVNAFAGCTKLTHVIITENSNLTTIGRSAFEGCSKFVAIADSKENNTFVVPASVKLVGDYAFKGTAIKSLEFAENCTLAVGYKVFANCSSLVSVSISSTISSVDFDAFNGCTKINTISAPAKFVRVFSNVTSSAIKNLTITEGVVDCYYIREMPNLESLVIGVGVTEIDNKAFEGCSNLKSIEVLEGNARYSSEGNCIIETTLKALVLGCINSEIPAEVKTIKSYAFAQSNITKIIIPANVTKIEDYAFSACRKLTEITIENANIVIAKQAFDGCDKVTTVTIPANAIEYIAQVVLKNVTITSGEIKAGAFEDCLTLTNVTIYPDVVVNADAFDGCTGITTLTAPTSALAVVPADKVATLTINSIDADIEVGTMLAYKDLKKLIIVADAAEHAIDDLATATTVTEASIPAWAITKMPASLTKLTIASGVVADSAELPELKTLIFADGVTAIGDGVFADYITLTSVSLPETLTTIGNNAFSGCTALTTLDLSWVTTIGNEAFAGCTKLNRVTTTSLETIGDGAFSGCIALTSLNLPVANKIGAGAFDGCIKITKIVAPVVTEIGEGAFANCNALTDATVPAFAISSMPDSVTKLTVTSGKVVAEAGAEVDLPNLETLIFADGVTEIGNNAFANYTALKSVTLPETLTVIGENAFAGCVALESINLSKVEKIASKAFEDCNKLTVLDLSSLTEIGVQVFSIGVDGLNLEKAVVPSLSLMANNLPYYIKELVVLGEEINTDSLRTIQNLEKLTIGAGVIYVAADAIGEGTVIKTVIVDKNNAYYRFEDNMLINANDEVVWDFND